MSYSYKGRVEYKNPNEMCSFINKYVTVSLETWITWTFISAKLPTV